MTYRHSFSCNDFSNHFLMVFFKVNIRQVWTVRSDGRVWTGDIFTHSCIQEAIEMKEGLEF